MGSSKKFLLGMVGLVVVGLGIAAVAKPAYRQLKTVRSRRAAALGESLLVSGRLEEAARQARLAVELAPAEPNSLRLAGRISAMGMRPEALAYWQSYLATGKSLPSERVEVAELAVRMGRTDVARSLLEALVRETPQDRHVWRLLQAHVRNLGDVRQALSLARMVVAKFPGDTEAEVQLADLLVLSGDPKSREEGRRILWGVAMVPSATQPAAASILMGIPSFPRWKPRPCRGSLALRAEPTLRVSSCSGVGCIWWPIPSAGWKSSPRSHRPYPPMPRSRRCVNSCSG